jgi:hypothetical protein
MRESEDWIPREWLGSETSVEEVEADFQNFDEPWHTEWREFISKMQPGDQLRHFFSSNESWLRMAGRAGYAIVRQGEVVDAFITILS